MQRGMWLVEPCCCDKPKVVTSHSRVSYACLLVPVVKHFAIPRRGKSLRQRETDKGTSCYRHEVPGPDVGIICHGDHLSELLGNASSWPLTVRI